MLAVLLSTRDGVPICKGGWVKDLGEGVRVSPGDVKKWESMLHLLLVDDNRQQLQCCILTVAI